MNSLLADASAKLKRTVVQPKDEKLTKAGLETTAEDLADFDKFRAEFTAEEERLVSELQKDSNSSKLESIFVDPPQLAAGTSNAATDHESEADTKSESKSDSSKREPLKLIFDTDIASDVS